MGRKGKCEGKEVFLDTTEGKMGMIREGVMRDGFNNLREGCKV
jgi:hypothetical protein